MKNKFLTIIPLLLLLFSTTISYADYDTDGNPVDIGGVNYTPLALCMVLIIGILVFLNFSLNGHPAFKMITWFAIMFMGMFPVTFIYSFLNIYSTSARLVGFGQALFYTYIGFMVVTIFYFVKFVFMTGISTKFKFNKQK